ncbi:MAG: DUF2764 family protein [Kiritimatiellae bacterium]|nr:DUF2764 family protein [Kiritimatiellia bacterium]
MSYYYFAASLPMLIPEQPPPFSVESFRHQCASHLGPHDLAAMDELLGGEPAPQPHAFARRWQVADSHLRNAVARTRSERMRKDSGAYTRDVEGVDTSIDRDVADAYSRPTPLEREKAIDRIRWRRLEEIGGLDPFTADAVLAYGVQLTILERWARMDEETGAATVNALVERNPADKEDKS